jgi:hypothetical protein
MAKKKSRSSRKFSAVDPAYLDRQKESLKRIYRKSVLFNGQELAAIDEYCRRFKVSSRSALIREALMERILKGLEENHPTLF